MECSGKHLLGPMLVVEVGDSTQDADEMFEVVPREDHVFGVIRSGKDVVHLVEVVRDLTQQPVLRLRHLSEERIVDGDSCVVVDWKVDLRSEAAFHFVQDGCEGSPQFHEV